MRPDDRGGRLTVLTAEGEQRDSNPRPRVAIEVVIESASATTTTTLKNPRVRVCASASPISTPASRYRRRARNPSAVSWTIRRRAAAPRAAAPRTRASIAARRKGAGMRRLSKRPLPGCRRRGAARQPGDLPAFDRIEEAADHVGAGQLERCRAERGQQSGMGRTEHRESCGGNHRERVDPDVWPAGCEHGRGHRGRGGPDEARPSQHAVARNRSARAMPNGPRTAEGAMRAKATTPTASAPPSRNATTPMATLKAHSAVQTPPNASCARSKLGLRAVAEKARADAAKPLRTLCDTTDSITDRVSSQGRGFLAQPPA
jgi:hypothetical protein